MFLWKDREKCLFSVGSGKQRLMDAAEDLSVRAKGQVCPTYLAGFISFGIIGFAVSWQGAG